MTVIRGQAHAAGNPDGSVWAALFQGELCTGVTAAWARGLSRNRAVAEDQRMRLVGWTDAVLRYPQPETVLDAVFAHPDRKVWQHAAEWQPGITPGQWTRYILGARSERDRWFLLNLLDARGGRLTEAGYWRLIEDPSLRIRAEVAALRELPVQVAVCLAADPDASIRFHASPRAWPGLSHRARRTLLDDPHPAVRAKALFLHYQEHPLSRAAHESGELGDQAEEALRVCRLTRGFAEHLVARGDDGQRISLAGNPHTPPDLVTVLARDPDKRVRYVTSIRAGLTEEQRAAIPIEHNPEARSFTLDWVAARHDDPDTMRRLAASSHPEVRRSVARARHLPPDVVQRLANDDDRIVRLFLAESCDDAPADMLLTVWRWWRGSLSCPDRPRRHPNFPRAGLRRFADDPDPNMRRLALDDPDSPAALVERLSRDPDATVRYEAAADPRLSADTALRLLDDPEHSVRQAAAAHPGHSVDTAVLLLLDHHVAETAARTHSLPGGIARRMIDRITNPSDGGPGD